MKPMKPGKKVKRPTVVEWVGKSEDQAKTVAATHRQAGQVAKVYRRYVKAGRAIGGVWVVVVEI